MAYEPFDSAKHRVVGYSRFGHMLYEAKPPPESPEDRHKRLLNSDQFAHAKIEQPTLWDNQRVKWGKYEAAPPGRLF